MIYIKNFNSGFVLLFLIVCTFTKYVSSSGVTESPDEIIEFATEMEMDRGRSFVEVEVLELEPSESASSPEKSEKEPDDILNWFFYKAFAQLDLFLQNESDKEYQDIDNLQNLAFEEFYGAPNRGQDKYYQIYASRNWKIRASKVILKIALIATAIVCAVLFIIAVFIFMIVAFIITKCIGHIIQSCRERRGSSKSKDLQSAYHVHHMPV